LTHLKKSADEDEFRSHQPTCANLACATPKYPSSDTTIPDSPIEPFLHARHLPVCLLSGKVEYPSLSKTPDRVKGITCANELGRPSNSAGTCMHPEAASSVLLNTPTYPDRKPVYLRIVVGGPRTQVERERVRFTVGGNLILSW
jgi:hypothetical protein